MKTLSLVKHAALGVAALSLTLAPSLWAEQQVSAALGLPMHVKAIVDESGCQNSPGPQITLAGEIELGTVKARMIFSNNAKGTHTATNVSFYDVDLLLGNGSTIVVPKQPVLGGAGGNPHIYLQFTDGKGNPESDEFYLGRCVQGMEVSADLINEAAALATISAGDCLNRRGPTITLGGEIVLSGLNAKLILRNNVKGTQTWQDEYVVSLIMEGSKITIPKQPVKGGAGGNPIISIQFLNGNGDPLTTPVVLGRCVQL